MQIMLQKNTVTISATGTGLLPVYIVPYWNVLFK